jgi:hypothetical protein
VVLSIGNFRKETANKKRSRTLLVQYSVIEHEFCSKLVHGIVKLAKNYFTGLNLVHACWPVLAGRKFHC